MRLLLCWAVILDSLCCSTCNCLHSSSRSATAYMESVVSDGWSSPVPYASHKAGQRALSNWVEWLQQLLSTLRRKQATGKQLPLKQACRPCWVASGAALSGRWQEEVPSRVTHLLLNSPATAPRTKCLQASFPPSLPPNATGTDSRKWVM